MLFQLTFTMKTAYNAFLPTKRGTLSDTQFRSLYSPYSDGVACIQAYWAYAIGVFYYATHRPMDEFTWQPFAVYAYRINNINLLQVSGHTSRRHDFRLSRTIWLNLMELVRSGTYGFLIGTTYQYRTHADTQQLESNRTKMERLLYFSRHNGPHGHANGKNISSSKGQRVNHTRPSLRRVLQLQLSTPLTSCDGPSSVVFISHCY